jgi:SWI/SNF-related matrix-associated actin-dependent regulator 1 of chromatin subfamily A
LLQVLQAEDRAHRIGQTQSVNVHFLLVKDSIDDLMWELLQNKLTITGQVLDGEATRMEVSRLELMGRPT